jgi:ComF family protein
LPAADGICPDDHHAIQGLAWARAPFAFAGTGGALVRRFKLDGNAAAGRRLAVAMALAVGDAIHGEWRRAVLVPVPLHWRRRRLRGFDQAAQLARMVAARAGLTVEANVLVRRRATLPQGDPRVTSRIRNVEGVFELTRPRRVRGRLVLLLDDVCTSGATARACAAVLRRGGARAVALLTACRA